MTLENDILNFEYQGNKYSVDVENWLEIEESEDSIIMIFADRIESYPFSFWKLFGFYMRAEGINLETSILVTQ